MELTEQQKESPYYPFKFLPKEWWWCHVCNQWHNPQEDKLFAYNVCVDVGDTQGNYLYSVSLPVFISCSEEYCKKTVLLYNETHYRLKAMSKNPNFPVDM